MREIHSSERRLTPAALSAAASGNLKNFLAAATPGGIEAQEKAGQLEQAELETLPIRLSHGGSIGGSRKKWMDIGFQFGENFDDLFVRVKFPTGWKKVPTNHSIWSNIVDDKSRIRGSIFYRAAFYDRSAHAHLVCRFSVENNYERPLCSIFIKDACGTVNFKVSGLEHPDWADREEAFKRRDKQDEAKQACLDYLAKNFPDYENPLAYWE
jgi:hypothetical protein